MIISDLKPYDIYLYHQGTNYHSYGLFGAHFTNSGNISGVRFTVWAPDAESVSVVGNFNGWDKNSHIMKKLSDGEIWHIFIPHLTENSLYKYAIKTADGRLIYKADPYAFYAEKKPNTASCLYNMCRYEWHDILWQEKKAAHSSYEKPMLIYEVHLGSWRRAPANHYLSYRDAAVELINYVRDMHYTHIEFLPLYEHPFDGSWGYQATGYYAPTSRYGTPDDFRFLIDTAHQNGIGVIMDWAPGHFCNDEHGLKNFDGKNLYESDNKLRSENKQWGTTNFDYGRTEVHSFLISNAIFWLTEYHIDGLRIDAVANMLYLDYERHDDCWQPNKYGENGNLEAIEFIKKLNQAVFKYYPDALMIAEESTDWPQMSSPVHSGGMGFNYKWNMGWMNDILSYISLDPIYRKWHHDKITFSLMYAFSENFVLPLSHDEVVHGKCSLIEKMPGDYWQKFAGLRVFFAYWIAHPGKKLLFMGGEFGQFIEWNYDDSLDWHLTEKYPMHNKLLHYSKTLNKLYIDSPPLWQIDFDWNGFTWLSCDDKQNSIVAFMRKTTNCTDFLIAVFNFTPQIYYSYRIGIPIKGGYTEIFNSDDTVFGGSGITNTDIIQAEAIPWNSHPFSISLTIPPLACVYLHLSDESYKLFLSEKSNSTLFQKHPLISPAKNSHGCNKRKIARIKAKLQKTSH
ncbi:1,4-alpha-glucan branching protein GlgB [Pectinatus haikarae]|uniref:1,4-alpha-glucan branching enzyme GlgB n=1 Tax=Pectinatus haikarae TaxID=349096 RepID=A0ABT9Y6K3_9FIRM|nr:1,4-alpha-glucan branching protein GlgB [Pectinatus haikarae]MDQ0203465.1 1,4-alpha-glucan branching enzyme [Pectinatus haikarae]